MKWKIVKYAIIVFVIISIAIAFLSFYNLSARISPLSYEWDLMIFAVITQVISILFVVLCWKTNLRNSSVGDIDWLEAVTHIGLNSMGKYAPGKILGSVARGFSTYNRYGNFNGILMASAIEQIAMIHSGLILYAVFKLFDIKFSPWHILIISLIAISFMIIPFILKITFKYMKKRSQSIKHIKTDRAPPHYFRSYLCSYLILTIVWLFTSVSLFLVARSVGVNCPFITSVLATTSGYLSGFAAIFLPAGIGVRESVVVVYMAKMTSASVATSIALILRLINVAIDISIGLFAIRQGYRYER